MLRLANIVETALNPALALLPAQMDGLPARVLVLAIGLQESRFEHRFQVVEGNPSAKGPARSFWQMERGGGVAGVLRHNASRYWANHLCEIRGVAPKPMDVWLAIENDDVLAAGLARLLLFTDPKRLPPIGDIQAAWEYYARVWRPGKPHRETWDALYAQAVREAAPTF